MKKILFVGEHPNLSSGNSHMLNALLQRVNREEYNFAVFATTYTGAPVIADYELYEGGADPRDEFGEIQLINFLDRNKFDVIIFVGIDAWRYSRVSPQLAELKRVNKFTLVSIFPFDFYTVSEDFLDSLSLIDIPCVYSQYGYEMLKGQVKNLHYFRPTLFESEKFGVFSEEEKQKSRKKLFKDIIEEDTVIFGFFGNNQFRKDPLRAIKAFFEVKKQFPNIALYLHMNLGGGVYNIEHYIRICGGQHGDVLVKKQNHVYSTNALVEAYNVCDCLINTSLQEGLSWTILEAQLCGLPVIAANSTSQVELLEGGAGIGIPPTDIAHLPVLNSKGESYFVESKACNYSTLVYAMKSVMEKRVRTNLSQRGLAKANAWIADETDINDLLNRACSYTPPIVLPPPRIQKVLFAQHSAAGDVFMTTRCFEDLKKRHPNLPFVYMTTKKYQDIIVNNPFVDEIIDWDEKNLGKYQIVYNPHGDRILPGHWGRNSNSLLSDFYWKVLMIEKPGDFFIEKKRPEEEIAKIIEECELPICILHSTGGDSEFRTYKYLGDVAADLCEYRTIQVGGKDDFPAGADIDLRGKLSYRETAWVIDKAKIAVTVDSFISHLCGALGVSQVCLFGSGNHFVVRPNQLAGKLICLVPDHCTFCKGLGPCSASVRDCPVKCTGLHDPKTILEKIKEIEEGL